MNKDYFKKINMIKKEFKRLSGEWLDEEWTLRFTEIKSRMGQCCWDKNTIDISIHWVRRISYGACKELIGHEVAHALVSETWGRRAVKTHGKEFYLCHYLIAGNKYPEQGAYHGKPCYRGDQIIISELPETKLQRFQRVAVKVLNEFPPEGMVQ